MLRRAASIIVLVALVLGLLPLSAGASHAPLPLCSAAVHDSYKTTGPDGQQYKTWHPQVDHVNNCHFDHEHGSNPGLLAPVAYNGAPPTILPAFEYTASKHGMAEGHVGFKVIVINDVAGYRWMITSHFGTNSPPNAACNRFHTLDILIYDPVSKTIKADLHLMADFGKATSQNHVRLTPTACPDQGTNLGGSTGARLIPVLTENGVMYEPWRTDSREYPLLGLRTGGFTINTTDPQKQCNAIVCDSGATMMLTPTEPGRGAFRLLTFNDGGANGPFRITGTPSGTFYTDAHGRSPRVATDPDAVKQYVAPGFSVNVPGGMPECRSAAVEAAFFCSTVIPSEMPLKLNRYITGVN
jgi:hypothetical protein